MIIHYNFQQFKKALNRNFKNVHVINYIGDMPSCAKSFFIETKKALIMYDPETFFDAYRFWNMSKDVFKFVEVRLGW